MIKKVELDLGGGKVLSLETGKLAKEANGSVTVRLGDTMIIATAVMSDSPRPGMNFFPLLVDFEEKLYAAGKIPGGFFKREGKPTENAILTARRIDRPIRPLFPKEFRNDVQLVITPLSVDQEIPPDILAIIGASTALAISDIPFDNPIAAARVAKVGDELIVDPTITQMKDSVMDLVVAATSEKVLMIECGSEEVPEADIIQGIKDAHKRIKEVIKLQQKLAKEVGKAKKEVVIYAPNEQVAKFVKDKAAAEIAAAMSITDKSKRMAKLGSIKDKLVLEIKEGKNEELKKLIEASPADISTVIEKIEKATIREMIVKKGQRPDGRGINDLRELNCEVGVVPRVHGSAIFSRGQTQVLTVATLGSLGEVQRLDGLTSDEEKRYMHHYNFPAFSVGEVRPLRGPGRREIGHGALAERSLLPVIPDDEKFPYTIRLVTEVLGSNGSTSMAATCGSTLALMDAGVKIDSPVAGISIGLVKEGSKEILLTDIQGIEDFLGDMDFKVSGTRKGVTGIQVDVKIDGLSHDLIEKTFKQAKEARSIILDKIEAALAAPREELSPFAPRVNSIQIDPEKIGMVIGPGGKMIRKIIEDTGAQIDIDDSGTVLITSADSDGAKAAQKMIEDLTYEPKVGEVFRGKVMRIMAFGAFVELVPGKEGLVHVSQISQQRVAKVEDVLKVGDEAIVKLMEKDDKGRLNLSMKAVTEADKQRIKE